MSFKSSLKSLFWSGILVAALALLVGCTPGAPVTTETTGVTPTEAVGVVPTEVIGVTPTEAMGVTPEIPVTGAQFTADLTGAAEVPGPGDEDGSGTASVTLNEEAGEVCFEISASNITLPASAAHIHTGSADVAGDVVVPLTPPDASGASSDCVSDVEPGLIQAILTSPDQYYVNVHTSDFPDGAIRGQLSP